MSEYWNFTRTDLEEGFTICDDVCFSSGASSKLFLSDSRVYALSQDCKDPKKHFAEIQDAVKPLSVRLYIFNSPLGTSGLYDVSKDLIAFQMDEDAISEDLYDWLNGGIQHYDRSVLECILSRLKNIDIKARGYFVQEDGELLLYRHGKLYKASPASPDRLFYLTLFLGPLGAHKFALGKFMSGIVYFITGGIFLTGWLFDVVQLFIGMPKDKKKRYLFPMKNRKIKLLILPFGLLFGAFLFVLFSSLSNFMLTAFFQAAADELRHTDIQQIERAVSSLGAFFAQ